MKNNNIILCRSRTPKRSKPMRNKMISGRLITVISETVYRFRRSRNCKNKNKIITHWWAVLAKNLNASNPIATVSEQASYAESNASVWTVTINCLTCWNLVKRKNRNKLKDVNVRILIVWRIIVRVEIVRSNVAKIALVRIVIIIRSRGRWKIGE